MKRLRQFAVFKCDCIKGCTDLTCWDYLAVGGGGGLYYYSILTAGSLQLRVSNLKSARRSECFSHAENAEVTPPTQFAQSQGQPY